MLQTAKIRQSGGSVLQGDEGGGKASGKKETLGLQSDCFVGVSSAVLATTILHVAGACAVRPPDEAMALFDALHTSTALELLIYVLFDIGLTAKSADAWEHAKPQPKQQQAQPVPGPRQLHALNALLAVGAVAEGLSGPLSQDAIKQVTFGVFMPVVALLRAYDAPQQQHRRSPLVCRFPLYLWSVGPLFTSSL